MLVELILHLTAKYRTLCLDSKGKKKSRGLDTRLVKCFDSISFVKQTF